MWIAVHEEVLSGKLRGFRKKVGCSEAEALGILTILWLWARKNADMTGLIDNADRDDIAAVVSPYVGKVNPRTVADALVEEEWLDEKDGVLYVHDWYEWQQYWFNYLDRKEKDKLRKRKERAEKASSARKKNQEQTQSHDDDKKPTKKKEVKPPKTKYADAVTMYPEERQKLVDSYGEEFTVKLIEELNNYKLSNGKSYKDDYRAILSWVVEKCEKKYPNLKKSHPVQMSGNPFADCLE